MRPAVGTPLAHPVPAWTWPRLTRVGMVAFLVRLDAAYRQRCALQALDDRMLKDIGITRADVESEVAGPLLW